MHGPWIVERNRKNRKLFKFSNKLYLSKPPVFSVRVLAENDDEWLLSTPSSRLAFLGAAVEVPGEGFQI